VIAQGLHDLFAREQNHRSEIEVIADGAELIIDQRMIRELGAALLTEIGVDEGRARVVRHLNESLRRARAELYSASGQDQQQVIRPPHLDQRVDRGAGKERVDVDRLHAVWQRRRRVLTQAQDIFYELMRDELSG
jgi:hypothetical protein